MPNVHTVTDEDTGEILIFALWGQLEHVKLFELTRKLADGTTERRAFDDYS
jgi:hypothetical protein